MRSHLISSTATSCDSARLWIHRFCSVDKTKTVLERLPNVINHTGWAHQHLGGLLICVHTIHKPIVLFQLHRQDVCALYLDEDILTKTRHLWGARSDHTLISHDENEQGTKVLVFSQKYWSSVGHPMVAGEPLADRL
jgi:hypothetical protein